MSCGRLLWGFRNTIPPDHQSQDLKGCPLRGLHVLSYCGKGWQFYFCALVNGHWPLGTTSLLDKLIAWLSVRPAQSKGMSRALSGVHPLELTGSGTISKIASTSADIREVSLYHKNGSHQCLNPWGVSQLVFASLANASRLVIGVSLSMTYVL